MTFQQPQELEIDPRTGMKNYIANGEYSTGSNKSSSHVPQRTVHGIPQKLSSGGPLKDASTWVVNTALRARSRTNTKPSGFLAKQYVSRCHSGVYMIDFGQMHTLEDFPAHSNFCELALVSMGHHDVFVHVGDHVKVQALDGKWVSPIITGKYFYLCRNGLR